MFTKVDIPGYVTGTWVIDAARSAVTFQARQFGFAKATGTFAEFEGTIVTAENLFDSSARAVIRTASVDTRSKRRDKHLHTADFLSVEEYPDLTFTSTGVRAEADAFLMDGELTVRDVTRPVTLTVTPGFDTAEADFTATTEISRKEFGVTGGASGAVIGDTIKITLQVKATKQD